MKKYLYFPGCSLKGTGRAYEESLLSVFGALDIELEEIEDWNCCGATAYMSVDEEQSYALAGRNLAIAERSDLEIVAPCSACYLGLKKAQKALEEQPEIRRRVTGALKKAGLEYKGTAKVRHPLDVLVNDIGLGALAKYIQKPLKGHKFAPYYGCQIVRPYADFDDQHDPQTMDRLLAAAGAECVPYPLKTHCCGGSLTGTMPQEVGMRLGYLLLNEAKKRGAEAVVTVCPLCQFNLDGYQDGIAGRFGRVDIPVVYFTQVLGLAMGLGVKELGLQRGIISAEVVFSGR